MSAVQTVAAAGALLSTAAGLVIVAWAVYRMVRVIRLGAPDQSRRDEPGLRWRTMFVQTLAHTKMLKWRLVGVAHWFVFVAFGALFVTLVEAYGELFNPYFDLPLLGGWAPYGFATEFITVTGLAGIFALMVIRQRQHPRDAAKRSRFAGSTMWQGYYVEWTIVGVLGCLLLVRGFRVSLDHFDYPVAVTPVSHLVGDMLPAWKWAIPLFAAAKIIISMAWLVVIGLNLTMGVAWHRFSAFVNIWFGRNADGKPALGALKPMTAAGKPLDFEEADPEKDPFGVSQVEQFSWKGLLDFTTCTECGRCQSQCPAWNTGKPLSPKLIITSLRDHAYAKAPYLLAGGGKNMAGEEQADAAVLSKVPEAARAEAERPLVDVLESGGVIDPAALWACTMCGACVEQCPVDIEHVDHIADMRRYQVLIEAKFPSEAGTMLRNLESKGNPWGENPNAREDWTKGLPFEVIRVTPGEPIDDDIEYLFWVGCAGAYDAKARKTTRAVAELLHAADVRFAILGKGETCTGDPARRMGNEFTFVQLATQNVQTLGTTFQRRIDKKRRAVVATCPHCFNTLANEYPQLGGDYDVVHHTELLARLLKEGRLRPTQPVEQHITYHDPCFLGRHNRVFAAPRELLGALPGAKITEMPRNSERSFCCGAGGARMWMEEKVGKRINIERTEEAVSVRPDTVVAACPFCATMLGDGIESKKGVPITAGGVPDHVAVTDVAQLLHKAVIPAPEQEQ